MKHHKIEQNTPEWDKLRTGRITSSKFDVLYMDPKTKGYKEYAYKIAYERLTGEQMPQKWSGDASTEAGHEREQSVINDYENATFRKVHPGGFFELDEWVGGSPDGLVEPDGLAEVKNLIMGIPFKTLLDYGVPRKFVNQCNGQLYVSGREWVDLIIQPPSRKFKQKIYTYTLTDEKRQEIDGKIEEFKEAVKSEMERLKSEMV